MFIWDMIKTYLFLVVVIVVGLYMSGVDFPHKAELDKFLQDLKTKYIPDFDFNNALNSLQKELDNIKKDMSPTPGKK